MAGNWRDLRTVFEFAGISEPNKEAPGNPGADGEADRI
jgi:hypothetical protein